MPRSAPYNQLNLAKIHSCTSQVQLYVSDEHQNKSKYSCTSTSSHSSTCVYSTSSKKTYITTHAYAALGTKFSTAYMRGHKAAKLPSPLITLLVDAAVRRVLVQYHTGTGYPAYGRTLRRLDLRPRVRILTTVPS
jgi:hypothetical protein